MIEILRTRFSKLWKSMRLEGDPNYWFDYIVVRYSERHRFYHVLEHIFDCLEKFDWVKHLIPHPSWVEFALFIHDLVYSTDREEGKLNERLSAEIGCVMLQAGSARRSTIDGVSGLVMVTKGHKPGTWLDAQYACDIDCSILGAPPQEFNIYNENIRREYAHVPLPDYIVGRTDALVGLAKPVSIFSTDYFSQKYELQARLNIERALAELPLLTK